MHKISGVLQFGLAIGGALFMGIVHAQQARLDVLVAGKLTPGFEMGVNSSESKTNWLRSETGQLRMTYPSDQSWGAVFVTVQGSAKPRPFRDMSVYNTLTIEMKGGLGGERLDIGIKSNGQPDNGTETKVPTRLSSEWKSYDFRLEKFDNAELEKLYVVTEFVFSGPDPATVYFRNISYSNTPK